MTWMLEIGLMILDAEWVPEKGFYVWCTDKENHTVELDSWRDRVFSRHKASFYGTFLEETSIGKHEAVLLSPWLALDFFANAMDGSLLTIECSGKVQEYMMAAKPLYEVLESGEFMPDFSQWREGTFGWKTDGELDEFSTKWLSSSLLDWTREDSGLREAWEEITEDYPLIVSTETDSFVDEQNWLELIGWKKDETPFQVILRIDEPEVDNGNWKLETILQNKNDSDDQMVWHGIMPRKWEAYANRVERDHELWGKIVPTLKGRYEGIAGEITELEAWDFLMEDSQRLINAGVEIQLPAWWQAIKEAQMAVKAKVKTSASTSGRQSFVGLKSIIDFDWRFSTNGVELSEDEFMQLVDQKRRLINIRGKWIKLDPAFMKQVQSILQKANKEGLHFRDVLEQELLRGEDGAAEGFEDDNRAFAKIEIQLNRHLSNMIKQLTEITELPKVDVPTSFKGELRPYQQHGVEWLLFLRRFGFGACLADDMGLGKTIQMIAYFLTVKEQSSQSKPALIICPTSVLGNWQKELEKFGPTLNVHLHYGPNRGKGEDFKAAVKGADVVLTSYGLSHLDFEELSDHEWSTVCLDEAQNIKNAHTKQSRSIRKLHGEHHIALTGTPMENRLTELWSIYDFTNAGYLGSLGQFQKRYVAPIEKDRDTEKIEQVQRLIRPFLLRRTKLDKEVALNLPEKLEQKEYCPLTVEQASLYEQLVKDTFEQVEQLAGMQRKGLILKMLSKLKQVCDHPALYLKEGQPKDILGRSSKMEKLSELVANIREQNESCLIFTQYIFMGEMIREELEKQFGESVLFLNGSVSKAHRDAMIEDFQDGKHSILILSLKAGGTGLNLTAANHVIHYDRWWNPAVENQATDRAYRIGQSRFVHVHKFISTGTLEEKIDDMLEQKQSLNDQIIQSESWITELSTTELKDLFTLR